MLAQAAKWPATEPSPPSSKILWAETKHRSSPRSTRLIGRWRPCRHRTRSPATRRSGRRTRTSATSRCRLIWTIRRLRGAKCSPLRTFTSLWTRTRLRKLATNWNSPRPGRKSIDVSQTANNRSIVAALYASLRQVFQTEVPAAPIFPFWKGRVPRKRRICGTTRSTTKLTALLLISIWRRRRERQKNRMLVLRRPRRWRKWWTRCLRRRWLRGIGLFMWGIRVLVRELLISLLRRWTQNT